LQVVNECYPPCASKQSPISFSNIIHRRGFLIFGSSYNLIIFILSRSFEEEREKWSLLNTANRFMTIFLKAHTRPVFWT
jgi:hypothetical protein